MRFIDSIMVAPEQGTSRAVFFVDPAAEYLADHFPGAPTLPGLVMLEAAVRAAAALCDTDRAGDIRVAGDTRVPTLEHVERLQVVRRVVPGETLVVDVTRDPGTACFTARGTVGDETAMRARFRLRVRR